MPPTQSGSNRAARRGVIGGSDIGEKPGLFSGTSSGNFFFHVFGPPVGDPITKTRLESFLGTVRSYLTSFTTGSFIWTPFVPIITLFGTLKTGPNCLCQAQPSQNRLFCGSSFLGPCFFWSSFLGPPVFDLWDPPFLNN